jgi:hypothetical protein
MDVRFTQKGDELYLIFKGAMPAGRYVVKDLRVSGTAHRCSDGAPIALSCDGEDLVVQMDSDSLDSFATAICVEVK